MVEPESAAKPKIERPRSTRAQIVQAAVASVALAVAVFGYFYTVRPIYTKQRAEEDVAQLQKEAATLRSQIATYKSDLPAYVIEQLVARSLAAGADLLNTSSLTINYIHILYPGADSSIPTDDPNSASDLYFKRGVPDPDKSMPPHVDIVTGREWNEISAVLNSAYCRLTTRRNC